MSLRQDPILLSKPLDAVEPRQDRLAYEYRQQGVDEWCWAACFAMVLKTWSVRRVVAHVLDRPECQDDEPHKDCRQTLHVSRIEPVWEGDWREGRAIEAEPMFPLAEDTLREAIRGERFAVEVFVDKRHLILVVGVFRHDDDRWGFLVHDPFVKRSWLEWEWETLNKLIGEQTEVRAWKILDQGGQLDD